jgi:hypothetical protein
MTIWPRHCFIFAVECPGPDTQSGRLVFPIRTASHTCNESDGKAVEVVLPEGQ